MRSKKPAFIGYVTMGAILVLLFLWISNINFAFHEDEVLYSDVIGQFENGNVSSFSLDIGDGTLIYQLEGEASPREYKMPYVDSFIKNLDSYTKAYQMKHPDNPHMVYDFSRTSTSPILLYILQAAFPLMLMVFFFISIRNMQKGSGSGGMFNIGKAKVKDQSHQKTMFADVAGADEEKAELQEIVQFLKSPKEFLQLGARIPHGVLLVGPPGTGKTLLARACAGEAGVPFYTISGSDFVEMYVGVGASRVRDLFEKAKATAPAIIFIDEIDAVGRQRGAGLGGGHDEREQTLNQLLVQMDGFEGNEGVIVIAATNRADILDKALLRPGRFDRQIYVGIPDIRGREAILRVHTSNKPLGPDVDLHVIARTTPGFTGADLENLVNEAALLAARNGRKSLTDEDVEEATIKVVAGPEKKSRVISEKERRLLAYHEAGHAITAYYCETSDPVHQITIIGRGMMGGFTMYRPQEDEGNRTKIQMKETLVSMLGGRVAEQLILSDISTGASNDLERATKIARAMITRYGFSEKLGVAVFETDSNETFLGRDLGNTRGYSEEIARQIDSELQEILEEAYKTAMNILQEHVEQLHLISKKLMEQEKMTGDEFYALMEGGTTPAPDQPPLPPPEAPSPHENRRMHFNTGFRPALDS